MKLKISREVSCRILKCDHCGEWIETHAPSYRDFGRRAQAHVEVCSWKWSHPNYDEEPDEICMSFTVITERKFEVAEYDEPKEDAYQSISRALGTSGLLVITEEDGPNPD